MIKIDIYDAIESNINNCRDINTKQNEYSHSIRKY